MWHLTSMHGPAVIRDLLAVILSPFAAKGNSMRMNVIIRLRARSLAEFETAVKKLSARGLRVERRLPRISVVTGSIAENRLPNVSRYPFVEAVEKEGTFQLAPQDD
jgi:hypothetical protein